MKNLFLRITRPVLLPYWWQDLLLWYPRLYAGYLLAFDFGASKFGMPWSPSETNLRFFEVVFWFPEDVSAYGGLFALFPAALAWLGAFSEAVGGLALMLGFQTRLFSLLIACTMLVAAYVQQGDRGLWAQLPALGFLWLCLYTMVAGGGRFSVDYLISKKRGHEKV